jgi:predicted amidophosphoribosyltransferase
VALDGLLDWLFPSTCLDCGSAGAALCAGCIARAGSVQRFVVGGLPAAALGTYAGTLRRAVLAMKRGRRDLAESLAEALFARFGSDLSRDVVLVPVPTSAARRAARGFDQGLLLARGLGVCAGLPVLCVLSESASEAQQGRDRAARLASRERFVCAGPVVAGMRALLIDDVATTGATLRDCAAALRGSGADVCGALVVARALAGAAQRTGEALHP